MSDAAQWIGGRRDRYPRGAQTLDDAGPPGGVGEGAVHEHDGERATVGSTRGVGHCVSFSSSDDGRSDTRRSPLRAISGHPAATRRNGRGHTSSRPMRGVRGLGREPNRVTEAGADMRGVLPQTQSTRGTCRAESLPSLPGPISGTLAQSAHDLEPESHACKRKLIAGESHMGLIGTELAPAHVPMPIAAQCE